MAYASRYLRLSEPPMMGPDVENVQRRLNELGYYTGDINGIYDKATAEAVRSFQKNFNLVADGIVGPLTWDAIGLEPGAQEFYDQQYHIIIDLDKKELTLLDGPQFLYTWPVAVGKPSTPSPVGQWRIIQKIENPGGPFGTRWMRLSVPWGAYGIHGTNNPSSIGKAVSHGCIRMYNEDVEVLYGIVPLGTRVDIIGDVFTGRLLYLGVEPGSDIAAVQQILYDLGYYTGPIDGIYGTQTRDAVIAFQRDYGLAQDGVVGPETYNALQMLSDTLLRDYQP
jgi:L,D-transpeptidase ErfK/SrfK